MIQEVSEREDEDEVVRDAGPTPMVTALLRPRMLQLRAAYSRQLSRRKRLDWLHDHGVHGGAEARLHGERLHIERQRSMRRLRLRPDPRPAEVMGVRASDRREDELAVLAAVVRPGTTLLRPPPPPNDDAVDDDQSLSLTEQNDGQNGEWSTASRTLENWTGLAYSSTVVGTASLDARSSPSSPDDLRRNNEP